MATVDSSSTLEKSTDVPKELNNEGCETSAEFDNIQDGGHVVSSTSSSLLQQNSLGIFVPAASGPQVGKLTRFSLVKKWLECFLRTMFPR